MELKLSKNFYKRLETFKARFGIEPTHEDMKWALEQNEVVGNGGNTIGWDWLRSKGISGYDAKGKELTAWHDTYAGDTLCDLGRMVVDAEAEALRETKQK